MATADELRDAWRCWLQRYLGDMSEDCPISSDDPDYGENPLVFEVLYVMGDLTGDTLCAVAQYAYEVVMKWRPARLPEEE